MKTLTIRKPVISVLATGFAVACTASLQAGEPPAPIVTPPSNATCPWGVAAEALFLKAYSNENNFDDQDEEWGYRLEFSFKPDARLGYRLRYFDWDGTNPSDRDYDYRPEMTAWDLEVFDFFQLGNWAGEYSIGLRYAEYSEESGYRQNVDFDGWGPTLGVELTHSLVGPLSIYAAGRASLVYGDDDENYDDSFVPILELGLGLQYDFQLFGDCQSYVRLGIEAQNWASISDDDNEDTGIFGAALKFGTSF